MKTSYHSFEIIILLFSFSIFFVSCSNEPGITTPNENLATNMAKTVVLSTASFDHTLDTVITFPKSGKTIVISKSFTAKQIADIDNYMATHNILTKSATMSPMLLDCSVRTFTNWELENTYQTELGKYLGIWCDYLTPAQCRNYGFNQLFIPCSDNGTINSNITTAVNAGFSTQNLMVGLGSSNSANAAGIINGTTVVGYYYIEEPFEKMAFGDSLITVLPYLANLIRNKNYSNKLFFSSWFLPYTSSCNVIDKWPPGGTSFYSGIENIFSLSSNSYLLCDEYYSNCCRDCSGYWDAFQSFYGTRNIANWMQVVTNNGSTGYYRGFCGTHSTDWSTLFGHANGYGMTNIWLYAYQTGDETAVQNFCNSAWATGWLLRQEKQICVEYKCIEKSCTYCSYPNNGDWILYDVWYTGPIQYVSY